MCGVLSGGVATWNTALDAAFAFQQLIDPERPGRQHQQAHAANLAKPKPR